MHSLIDNIDSIAKGIVRGNQFPQLNYADLTITDRRSNLDTDKVDKMLFIRSNFDLL